LALNNQIIFVRVTRVETPKQIGVLIVDTVKKPNKILHYTIIDRY